MSFACNRSAKQGDSQKIFTASGKHADLDNGLKPGVQVGKAAVFVKGKGVLMND
jgi:hypothetical protein